MGRHKKQSATKLQKIKIIAARFEIEMRGSFPAQEQAAAGGGWFTTSAADDPSVSQSWLKVPTSTSTLCYTDVDPTVSRRKIGTPTMHLCPWVVKKSTAVVSGSHTVTRMRTLRRHIFLEQSDWSAHSCNTKLLAWQLKQYFQTKLSSKKMWQNQRRFCCDVYANQCACPLWNWDANAKKSYLLTMR